MHVGACGGYNMNEECKCPIIQDNEEYLKEHPEVNNILIGGGQTGPIPLIWKYATCVNCGKQHRVDAQMVKCND